MENADEVLRYLEKNSDKGTGNRKNFNEINHRSLVSIIETDPKILGLPNDVSCFREVALIGERDYQEKIGQPDLVFFSYDKLYVCEVRIHYTIGDLDIPRRERLIKQTWRSMRYFTQKFRINPEGIAICLLTLPEELYILRLRKKE